MISVVVLVDTSLQSASYLMYHLQTLIAKEVPVSKMISPDTIRRIFCLATHSVRDADSATKLEIIFGTHSLSC